MALVGLGTRTPVAIQRHVTHSKPSRIVRRDNAPLMALPEGGRPDHDSRSLRRWFAHWPPRSLVAGGFVSPAVPPFVAVASTLSLLPPNTGLYAAVMSQPFTPALPTDSRSRSCREDPQESAVSRADMDITCRTRWRRRTGCWGGPVRRWVSPARRCSAWLVAGVPCELRLRNVIIMSNVIVVIGPGSIGQAIARRVSAGRHVLLAGLHQENADAAAEVLSNAGSR